MVTQTQTHTGPNILKTLKAHDAEKRVINLSLSMQCKGCHRTQKPFKKTNFSPSVVKIH